MRFSIYKFIKKEDKMLNRFLYIAPFILFLFVFISCQENTTDPETINIDTNILLRDRMPPIDVEGIVYKDSNPVEGVTVKLYKGVTYLDQDITDNEGYYLINICNHHQGAGWYSVKATKDFKGQEW
jgi:hypothetical protein